MSYLFNLWLMTSSIMLGKFGHSGTAHTLSSALTACGTREYFPRGIYFHPRNKNSFFWLESFLLLFQYFARHTPTNLFPRAWKLAAHTAFIGVPAPKGTGYAKM